MIGNTKLPFPAPLARGGDWARPSVDRLGDYNSRGRLVAGLLDQRKWLAESGGPWLGLSGVLVRVRRRRHAASQGFDAGAKPSQHRRSPEHPVSAQQGPERRALEWARAAACSRVGKEPYAWRLVLPAVVSGTLREGLSERKSMSA